MAVLPLEGIRVTAVSGTAPGASAGSNGNVTVIGSANDNPEGSKLMGATNSTSPPTGAESEAGVNEIVTGTSTAPGGTVTVTPSGHDGVAGKSKVPPVESNGTDVQSGLSTPPHLSFRQLSPSVHGSPSSHARPSARPVQSVGKTSQTPSTHRFPGGQLPHQTPHSLVPQASTSQVSSLVNSKHSFSMHWVSTH